MSESVIVSQSSTILAPFAELGTGYFVDLGVSGGWNFGCRFFCTSPAQFLELIAKTLPCFINNGGIWLPGIDVEVVKEGIPFEKRKKITLITKPDGFYYKHDLKDCFDRRGNYPCNLTYDDRVEMKGEQFWEHISFGERHFLYDNRFEKPTSPPDMSDILPLEQMKKHNPRFIEIWIEHDIIGSFPYCSTLSYVNGRYLHRLRHGEIYPESTEEEFEIPDHADITNYLVDKIDWLQTILGFHSQGDKRVLLLSLLPAKKREIETQTDPEPNQYPIVACQSFDADPLPHVQFQRPPGAEKLDLDEVIREIKFFSQARK